jgi:hypothetical protein
MHGYAPTCELSSLVTKINQPTVRIELTTRGLRIRFHSFYPEPSNTGELYLPKLVALFRLSEQ